MPLHVSDRYWAKPGSRISLDRDEAVHVVMHAASVERRRALARALHEAPRVDTRFSSLHVLIVLYRERAAALFRQIVALEAAGNDITPLRLALIACSEKIEGIATVVGAPEAGMPSYDWLDVPTIPRRRL